MTALPSWGRACVATLAMASLAAGTSSGAGKVGPGAYCPLPKRGETPKCLEPAVDEYAEFFTALADGEVSDDDASRVETAVASGASGATPYLAISSLSFAYFRLAQKAAEDPGIHPAVVARLERWNELLARAYDVSAEDPSYRAAVREAALDLKESAPSIHLRCLDERGETAECDSTEAVLRGFHRAGEQVGIRGALSHLFQRIFGGDDS
ncbi:MAG: hypothetical protein ACE5FL_12420 [Myxococcota bacterium]